ncbi:MAG: ABC transporter ATP-binding protein [Acidimicrobiales bacterium]|nr:ABC transporter ATP-binding protein [Acidimicrobiales bacterium]
MSAPSEPAITVDHVSKRFRRYMVKNQSVKSALFKRSRGTYEENWVLDDVSLDIPTGSTYGLIGSNGSGKSTLLKCMARILKPDKGSITVNGRLSALIELGAGFHPELSGRENVYLNGAVLGLKRREIDQRFDEIVSFAGRQVSEAIDQPIKTYSSGMYVRLGFSIAVNVEPEVLLVDEVLAVGDEEFQRRCHQRFEELSSSGRTVVIVSHALSTVAAMCDQVAWLERGKLSHVGNPQQVVDSYLTRLDFGNAAGAGGPASPARALPDVRITDITLDGVGRPLDHTTTELGEQVALVRSGQSVRLRMGYETDQAVPTPVFALAIHTLDGTLAANPSTLATAMPEKVDGTGVVELEVPSLMLVPGAYTLGAAILDAGGEHAIDKKLRLVRFEVAGADPGEVRGIVALNGRWGGSLLGGSGSGSGSGPGPGAGPAR